MLIRRAESYADYEGCVTLQELTWGADTRETVPAHLLSICQKVGGLVGCAFEELEDGSEGKMLGFVYGIAGWRDGSPVQWSHMLAVHPDRRDGGIGQELKWFQREEALADGVEAIYWTFDPLVSRNAHLNLNVLGAVVDSYHRDMYGTPVRDTIYASWGTDRFVARWDVGSERVASRMEAPVRSAGVPDDDTAHLLEIPWDVVALATGAPERVVEIRDRLRQVIPAALQKGHEIGELVRDTHARRAWYRTG